jgi:hypothetical protein
MDNPRRTLREVIDGGQALTIGAGPGPDAVSIVMWNGAQTFNVWMTFDGCGWENTQVLTYDPADDPVEAQLWAEEQLARLLAERGR